MDPQDQFLGRAALIAEMQRHRTQESYQVDLQVGDLTLPAFLVEQGLLHVDRMTSRPVAEYLRRHKALYEGKHVIDMGCGTGVLGIVALFSGASACTFSDVSEVATACTQNNVDMYGFSNRALVVRGDLFENPRMYSAHVIVANLPFSPGNPDPDDTVDLAFLARERLVPQFFHQAEEFLLPGGSIIMPYRKCAGKENDPAEHCRSYGFAVIEEEVHVTPFGVQYGGPLTIYHIKRAATA